MLVFIRVTGEMQPIPAPFGLLYSTLFKQLYFIDVNLFLDFYDSSQYKLLFQKLIKLIEFNSSLNL